MQIAHLFSLSFSFPTLPLPPDFFQLLVLFMFHFPYIVISCNQNKTKLVLLIQYYRKMFHIDASQELPFSRLQQPGVSQ